MYMQSLIIKMQETLSKHERSPSDILFMQEQIKKGPEKDAPSTESASANN